MNGSGKRDSGRVDYPPGWVDPKDASNFIAPADPVEEPEEIICDKEASDYETCEAAKDAAKEDNSTECFLSEENCENEKVETIGGSGDTTIGNGSITSDNSDSPVALTGDDFNTNANYDPFGLDSIDEVYSVTETVEVTTPDVVDD